MNSRQKIKIKKCPGTRVPGQGCPVTLVPGIASKPPGQTQNGFGTGTGSSSLHLQQILVTLFTLFLMTGPLFGPIVLGLRVGHGDTWYFRKKPKPGHRPVSGPRSRSPGGAHVRPYRTGVLRSRAHGRPYRTGVLRSRAHGRPYRTGVFGRSKNPGLTGPGTGPVPVASPVWNSTQNSTTTSIQAGMESFKVFEVLNERHFVFIPPVRVPKVGPSAGTRVRLGGHVGRDTRQPTNRCSTDPGSGNRRTDVNGS